MAKWKYTVRIKDLLTEDESWESAKESMANIAERLELLPIFKDFDFSSFRKISKGDTVVTPVMYSNILLNRLYDFADAKRIWIE